MQTGRKSELGPQKLEINPSHEFILKLYQAKHDDPALAKIVAEQIFNNALIAAGLMDDARSMLNTINSLLNTTLKNVQTPQIEVKTEEKVEESIEEGTKIKEVE